MYVPYNEIVESDVTDKVLIQGVVDLIIEKENSTVLDNFKDFVLKNDLTIPLSFDFDE